MLFLLWASCLCQAQKSYVYSPPRSLEGGLISHSLSTKNIDTILVNKLFNQLRNQEHKIHSVLVLQNNELLIEEYFADWTVDKQHDLRSTTKSITAILMGIALEKGFISSTNDPITKYLKDLVPTKNLDERKKEITIHHLLTMSSGLDCNDWDKKSKGQEDRVFKKKDWLQYFINLPIENNPGEVANYCTMGQILATEIISKASGQIIDEFAEKYLFEPLGITNVHWGHTSKKKDIISSGKRLYMSSRAVAKIGQLVLNKGSWKGKQIVSENWITSMTNPKTKITGIDYGYLWWQIPLKTKSQVFVAKIATGNGGQYIMVVPELDMVAVFTGGAYNSQEDKIPFAIMSEILLPTFEDL